MLACARAGADQGDSVAGKVFDRMSKGIREAPTKALIGDLAKQSGDRPEGAFGAQPSRPGMLCMEPELMGDSWHANL